ncbi:MAG: glycosyltransferase family 2 protein [Thermoflexales bacterium]|nr:glycosyltransferase family 2 protein [Thermoflexales bacterium]
MPTTSLILVNYNSGAYLKRCLSSLALGAVEREIILVDNASTDGSAEEIAAAFPRVRLVKSQVNRGFGGGCNLGARAAGGDYLAFLNPDTLVEPGWLEALVAALEAEPRAGLATPKILMLADPARINTCGNEMHLTGLTLCRGLGQARAAFERQEEVPAVSGAAFVIRRALFEALGGFDPDFFMYMEDTDLSLRARLAGYTCLYVPSSIVYHDYALSFGPRKTFYQERNRYLLLCKSLRWRTLLVLLPALLLAELVTWGFVLLRQPARAANKWQAYAWLARHWDQVLEARRRTQALRRVRDRALLSACACRLAYEQVGVGFASRLARAVFDPLFCAWRRLALALIRW